MPTTIAVAGGGTSLGGVAGFLLQKWLQARVQVCPECPRLGPCLDSGESLAAPRHRDGRARAACWPDGGA